MEIKEIPIGKLKPNPKNPRKIDFENKLGLENSLKRFGLVQPIVWNKRSGNIVGGNQKYHILKEQGVKKIECVVVDLGKREEEALNIALNNKGIEGEFTDDVVDMLEQIRNENPDLYDELRLFDIDIELPELQDVDEEVDDVLQKAELYEKMELQPFEHYDYVMILADNTQDWEYLKEFFKLEKVDHSFKGAKKIGLGRAVRASKFIELVKKDEDKK